MGQSSRKLEYGDLLELVVRGVGSEDLHNHDHELISMLRGPSFDFRFVITVVTFLHFPNAKL